MTTDIKPRNVVKKRVGNNCQARNLFLNNTGSIFRVAGLGKKPESASGLFLFVYGYAIAV